MRIAIISLMGGAPWGGSEALWHAIAIHAVQQGDEVFVSVYDWGKPHEKIKALEEKGITINFRKRYNPDAGKFEKIKRFIHNRKPELNKDYQAVIEFKPDIVFISQGGSFDLAIHHKALYYLLCRHKIPYSFICHSHIQYSLIPTKEIYPGAVEIFENAKQVFFISHRQWNLIERRLVMKITNGHFTWNPLNLSIPFAALDWPNQEIVQMAIVGNVIENKGQDTALEVLSAPQWKARRWVLNIYGDGYGKKYLQALAKYYQIEENIIFHGHVADMKNVWQQNHMLLIPSAAEGLPISLCEAMACGRMAVVTDVGGNTELIEEGVTGFVAASPTTESFGVALEKAWRKKEDWKTLGVKAQNVISQRLDKDPGKKLYFILTGN